MVLALYGLGLLGLSQATHLWFAVVCIVGINVVASITDILHHSLLQIVVEQHPFRLNLQLYIIYFLKSHCSAF